MNDILSGISEILDDPDAAAKISEIAKSLIDNSSSESTASSVEDTSTEVSSSEEALSEPAVSASSSSIGAENSPQENQSPRSVSSESVSNLFSGLGNINFSSSDRHINLLKAIQPYMRQERSEKINSAIKAISVLKTLSNIK